MDRKLGQGVLLPLFLLLGVLFFPWPTKGAPEEDQVLFMPGLDEQPTMFKHYAGFLQATGTRKFFYWFVESERNPSSDPVILWLNGGPGCSSMTGMLAELGPWRTKHDGSGLVWFEDRWNKIANIIFMESPQCVGYSHADQEPCSSTDNQTALDNHEALRDFFVKFPEYKTNEFFIMGESYAGIYVPTLSARIVDDPEFNFQGFAVGNSVTDDEVMANGYPIFAWGRGLIGSDLWSDLLDTCCVERNASNCQFYRSDNALCRLNMVRVDNIQWRMGLNPYDVYAECYGGAADPRGVYKQDGGKVEVMLQDGRNQIHEQQQYNELLRELSAQYMNVTVRIPCSYTDDREIYLNRPDVREALHVPETVQYWLPCTNLAYMKQYQNVRAEYNKVLEKGHRILSFYGDLDQACDHLGGMWFIESLGKELISPFKQWFYPDDLGFNQIAGFVIQYDSLTYASVKTKKSPIDEDDSVLVNPAIADAVNVNGAGHFVPTDSPVAAFIMYEKFLKNEPY